LVTEKQVQSLAKKMAILIGKIDFEVEKREITTSQEAVNMATAQELAKKNKKKD